MLVYSPICVIGEEQQYFIKAIDAFESMSSEDGAVHSFAFLQLGAYAAVIASVIFVTIYVLRMLWHMKDENEMARRTRNTIASSAVIIGAYTVFTYLFSPLNVMVGGYSESAVDYGPISIVAILGIVYAICVSTLVAHRNNKELNRATEKYKLELNRKKHQRSLFWRQVELLVFVFATAAVAIVALMSDIIYVDFSKTTAKHIPDFQISGADIILGRFQPQSVSEGIISYLVFALFFLTAIMLFLSLVSFIGRSSQYSKVAAGSLIVSSVSCMAVGLFGQYYNIVQELNKDIIKRILNQYANIAEELLKYEVTSDLIIYCFVLIVVLTVLFVRRPYTRAREISEKIAKLDEVLLSPAAEIKISSASIERPEEAKANDGFYSESVHSERADAAVATAVIADPCPAFTQLDGNISKYSTELARKREQLLENATLPTLVNYIVQYARDSKHHLFYTQESIATFLAGLGATRLTILQGMSGTGKTSLPKIVAEALMSVCDIVEVESSWRDKNELLGYYNEFSKIYTPKKFTQALYRACLNSDTITFIVLDEMNLSRIEYYFSDFLSLMENEPDKRELKLLNVPLYRTVNGESREYAALVDGHTVKIPQNIWFIGTANRDESTYDISDKVYDRAHTMNFDKRAQKPMFFGEPQSPKYLPASELVRLFDEACATVKADIDSYPVIKRAEQLLEPYNISFGNRIAMQIETFISIYVSCFSATDSVVNDAIDIIMLSKVVKKLELKSVEDKDTLAREFEKIGLTRCAGFVMSLKED
ncbi:MAG: hypothetical protein IJC64_03310 [Clostridia bacterium]|nr:hypothetical protein [Clostridia bacterium]